MRMGEDQPVFRGDADLPCVVFRDRCFEIYSFPEVLASPDDLADHDGCPLIGLLACKLSSIAMGVMLRVIRTGRHKPRLCQRPADFDLRQSGSRQLKDAPDGLRGLRIDEPTVFVFRVLPVAKTRMTRQRLSRLSPELRSRAHLPRLIFQVPLVHDIQDSGILATVGIGVVDAVVYGNEPHTHLFKIDFRVKAGFNVIAPDAAHILDDHRFDHSALDVRDQLLPARAFKIAAAVAVVRVVAAAGEPLFLCIAFK